MSDETLRNHHDGWDLPVDLYEIQGVYDPMQFAVRLHPDVQAKLSTTVRGVYKGNRVDTSVALAFGTYFHETIHWWQHIGSTLGLILSLCYPAQAHVNYPHLRRLLDLIGPVKSLRSFKALAGQITPNAESELNIALNNWHDIEHCRRIALRPEFAEVITRHEYFESIGHGYSITWASCVGVIAGSADRHFAMLPNVDNWEDPFDDLDEHRVEGYHHKSRVVLVSTGARAIFEGQARFSQLQYLHFSSGTKPEWDVFRSLGMLSGEYIAAFEHFLALIDETWPPSVGSPAVALFLAICDIAINPGEGFPFDIRRFETFIEDVDPGFRFFRLSTATRARKSDLMNAVADFSRAGYLHVAKVLSAALHWRSPIEICQRIANWPRLSPEAAAIAKEDVTFQYGERNLPIRVFTGRFMTFQRNKLEYPEFFVWPGAYASGGANVPLAGEIVQDLFAQHEPLFIVAPNEEIRPALIVGRKRDDIQNMFNAFYTWTVSYDLVRQWHVADGPFEIDFGWINPNKPTAEMKKWASRIFEQFYGCSPAAFRSAV